MPFQTCTELTFGLSDIHVITVIARNSCSTDVSIYNQALHRQEVYLTTKKVRKEFLCCIAKTKSWRQDPRGKYSYDRRLTGKLLTVLRTFYGFVDNMC